MFKYNMSFTVCIFVLFVLLYAVVYWTYTILVVVVVVVPALGSLFVYKSDEVGSPARPLKYKDRHRGRTADVLHHCRQEGGASLHHHAHHWNALVEPYKDGSEHKPLGILYEQQKHTETHSDLNL